MKSALKNILILSLILNSMFGGFALGSPRALTQNRYSQPGYSQLTPRVETPWNAIRKLRMQWKRSPTLRDFVTVGERRFGISAQQSFNKYLVSKQERILLSPLGFQVEGRKVRVGGSGPQTITLEFHPNSLITVNGVPLAEEDFVSSDSLLHRIQAISEQSHKRIKGKFVWFQLLWGGLVPELKADMGIWGFSAVVIGAGLLALGGYLVSKNLSHTKHEITVKTPDKLDVDVNHNIKVDPIKVSPITANLNGTATLKTEGFPENININIPTLGINK